MLLFAIDGARARREVDVDPLMDADACGGSPCQLACRALHHAEKMVIWRTGTKVSALRFVVFTTVYLERTTMAVRVCSVARTDIVI